MLLEGSVMKALVSFLVLMELMLISANVASGYITKLSQTKKDLISVFS